MNRPLNIFLVLLMILTGCAYTPRTVRSPYLGQDTPAGQCADFFAALDETLRHAGIRDPGEFRLKNHPYLRTDRFLASFAAEIDDETVFDDWVKRLQRLDQKARDFEIANLPPENLSNLHFKTGATDIRKKIRQCGDILKAIDFEDADQRRKFKAEVKPFDDYLLSRRILGLYPITSMFVTSGIYRYQDEVYKTFSNQPPLRLAENTLCSMLFQLIYSLLPLISLKQPAGTPSAFLNIHQKINRSCLIFLPRSGKCKRREILIVSAPLSGRLIKIWPLIRTGPLVFNVFLLRALKEKF